MMAPKLWRFSALAGAFLHSMDEDLDTPSTSFRMSFTSPDLKASKPRQYLSIANEAKQANGMVITLEFVVSAAPLYEVEAPAVALISPPESPEAAGRKKRRTGQGSFQWV